MDRLPSLAEVANRATQMEFRIFVASFVIHRLQRKLKWHTIIFEFLGETALPITGISEDALTQFFSVVDKLRVNSPRDSAERDKPSTTTDSLQLNAQSWTRIVTEVLGETALSVQTIPEDVLIQILEVVYEMRIHPEIPDPIENELNNNQPRSQSPEPQPERQPMETDGPIPPQDLEDLGAAWMDMNITPEG